VCVCVCVCVCECGYSLLTARTGTGHRRDELHPVCVSVCGMCFFLYLNIRAEVTGVMDSIMSVSVCAYVCAYDI